ncbi:MAG TPA: M48 family metallopeptidase [Puia sp.]|nr:M48 family metallopeptidase [Puia sp.]
MIRLSLLMILFAAISSCARNAVTGRKQLKVSSEAEIHSRAAEQYKQFLATHKVVETGSGYSDADMLQRVGDRLSIAVKNYFGDLQNSAVLANYAWEFKLVESREVSLWCMPGGKVVVYTGLLSVTQNETGLAIVLAHVITHDLAKHLHPGMTRPIAKQLGGVGLSVAEVNKPIETQLPSRPDTTEPDTEGLLPFTRRQEQEADRLGLHLAAIAGYDPGQALKTWEQASRAFLNNRPPQLTKTHPLDAKRISAMREEMARAALYYRP